MDEKEPVLRTSFDEQKFREDHDRWVYDVVHYDEYPDPREPDSTNLKYRSDHLGRDGELR